MKGIKGIPNWAIVFIVLAALGVLAITINWVYNAGQPLTPEKLAAARQLWKQHGPSDYDLKITRAASYTSSDGSGGTTVDRIDLQVRGGQVTSFLLNGKEPEPLIGRDGQRNVEAERRQRESYAMDGLFDAIEEFMELDRREGRRSFMRARFDKTDGHITMFTRQVDGKRVPHIVIELKKPG